MAGGKPGVMPWCRDGWPSPGRRNTTITTEGMHATSHLLFAGSKTTALPFPCGQRAASLGAQQWVALLWAPWGASRALTVGVAGQPHGGAASSGEPGVRCQVRSRVCGPAPGARQGRTSRHHQVGVQTVRGAAGGVDPSEIHQLFALSGHEGGKGENERV